MKRGIDISYHQGNINFEKLKESGIEFAILRSSYRNTIDPKFIEYAKGLKSVGITVLGVYHFIYAMSSEASRNEAEFCIKCIEEAGLKRPLLVFADFEYDSVNKAAAAGVTLGKNECNLFTTTFCETIESHGYDAGIYTNLDYYRNWYRKDVLDQYQIWLADYTGDPDYTCVVHQYSNKGHLPGINGDVDLDYFYEENFKMVENFSRTSVLNLAKSWLGKNEADGSHKEIVDVYNSFSGPLPRGVKMQYDWPWCACTWSALAIQLGYTSIMPIEISCEHLINAAKEMGCWVEDDAYVPEYGDAVLYDWQDNGIGDNVGWSDHVGVVSYANKAAGYFTVIEGNYDNAVKERTVSINGRYIRGFITPKYDDATTPPTVLEKGLSVDKVAHQVITGIWSKGDERKRLLESHGYNYNEVQNRVNEILNVPKKEPEKKQVVSTCYARCKDLSLSGIYQTTADLYCRNDAGTNKKALCLIPKGTKVRNYGFYNLFENVKWLYIQFELNGVEYIGFSSEHYLRRV